MIEVGKTVGNFEIKAEIGKGGMGTIFYAVDTMLNRDVALKVIHSQFTTNPQLMERFRIEAMAQARMNHPNIVMIFSFNKINEDYIIAMEYIDGKSLKEILKEQIKLDVSSAINYMKQILNGLEYAHSNNVIHRDIKPANIMITKDRKVKISDFGIAKIFGEQGLTKTGVMIGTPWYVSPEQILGKDIDFRTDLYSAGITFYEMLTGRVPFDSKTNSDFQIQKAHLETPPPRPSAFNSKIHPKLEKFILKALQKRPEKRFKSAKEMLEELEKIERDIMRDTIVEDEDKTVVTDTGGFANKKPNSLFKVLMVLFIIAIGLGIYLFISSSKNTVIINVNKEKEKQKQEIKEESKKKEITDKIKEDKTPNLENENIKEEPKLYQNINKEQGKVVNFSGVKEKIRENKKNAFVKEKYKSEKINRDIKTKKDNNKGEIIKGNVNINHNRTNSNGKNFKKSSSNDISSKQSSKIVKNEGKEINKKDIISKPKPKEIASPPELDIKLLKIRNFIKNKKLKKAEKLAEQIKVYPKSFAIIGKVKLLLGKYGEAEDYLAKALKHNYSISFYVYHKHGLINRGCKGTFAVKKNMILFESFTKPDHSFAVSKRNIVKVEKHKYGYGFFVERKVKSKKTSTTFLLVYKSNRRKNERFLANFINKYLLEVK